jgi:hypothetical protein
VLPPNPFPPNPLPPLFCPALPPAVSAPLPSDPGGSLSGPLHAVESPISAVVAAVSE